MDKKINEEEFNLSLKLLAKSSLFVLVGIVLSKILTYIFRIIIARHFGPEVYGLFSLASMILLLFYSLFSFGFPSGITRYISIYRAKDQINKIRSLLNSSKKILIVSSVISGIIMFLSADFISVNIFHNSNLIIFLKSFSIIIPFYIFYSFFMSILQAYQKIGWYSFIDNILQNAIRLIILIILLFIGLGIDSIIVSYALSILFIFLTAFYITKIKLPKVFKKARINKNTKKRITKDLFSYSWPLTLFALISYFFYWIDSFIIGYFKDVTMVGFYNAAVPIASLLIFVPTLFIQLFFPLIAREVGKKNFKLIEELTKQVTKWAFILNLPVFIIMVIFPGYFLNLLFGPEYIVAKNALIFLLIGSFFSSIFYLSNNLIPIIGKSKIVLINIIFVSLLNFILGTILIQKYGIDGVAFATMLSNIVLTLILLFEVKYYISIVPLRRKILRILVSAIIPTILLIYIRQFFLINLFTIMIQLIFFILLYIFMIFVTKSLDKNDLMVLRSFKAKINKRFEVINFHNS